MDVRNPSLVWRLSMGACSLIAAGSLVVSVVFVLAESREDRHDKQSDLDVNYLSCLRGNELRELNKTMVTEAFGAGSSTSGLTAVPSFADLPESVQRFFADLASVSAQNPGAASRRDVILADIQAQIRDCEAEWAGHTAGLRLPHNTSTTIPVTVFQP